MKISSEERFKKKILMFGRRNRLCRICAIPALALGMAGFHALRYIKGNGKRFSMIGVSALLFAVYSSFSFPGFITGEGAESGLSASISEEAENITLAVEAEIDLKEILILDDADVYVQEPVRSHGVSQESPDREETDGEVREFSRDDWRLLLVNKQNSIPQDYEVPLGSIRTLKGTQQCDERIIEDLLAMQKAAREEGISLDVCSPHRDYEYQQMLFDKKIRKYMNMGVSYMEAYQLSSQIVMVPGASEHQLGLALDIVTLSYTILDEGFAETPAGKWLAENSYKYGFVVRYPKGKEYITGVEYEPWHFRYVGVEAATVMTQEKLTLEEFWEEYL